MADQVKVKCLTCGKKHYVPDADVPDDAEAGEAFPCECVYDGCGGRYAERTE